MRPFIVFVGGSTILLGAWSGNWLVGLLAGLAVWFGSVQLWPWTACGSCGGNPRQRDFTGKNWRNCGGCGGSGRQFRTFVMRKDSG